MNNLSFRPPKLEIKIYITIEIIINFIKKIRIWLYKTFLTMKFWYLKIKTIGKNDKKDIKKIKYNKVI